MTTGQHNQPQREWLSCAETAKLVRKALKADFPGVKFSVRSSTYAGGASISVGWEDGPLTREVDGTLSLYSGASFDGMIDLKSYHDSLLMTDDGPRLVHFGADFVHSSRRISDLRRRIHRVEVKRFCAHIGAEFTESGMVPVSVHDGELSHDSHQGNWGSQVVEQLGWQRPWRDETCPGGDPSHAYCEGCGRFQIGHEREPHKR